MKKFYLLMVLVLMAAVALSAQNRVNFYGGVYGGMTEFDGELERNGDSYGYSIALGNFFHDKFALEFEYVINFGFDYDSDPTDTLETINFDYTSFVIMGKYYPINDWVSENMSSESIKPFITAGFANFGFQREKSKNYSNRKTKGASFILGLGVDFYCTESFSAEFLVRNFFNSWDPVDNQTYDSNNYMLNAGFRYHF